LTARELAGNIGVPALDLLDRADADVTVLELSSFQIADLVIGPQVALVTNLFREHADWHGSVEAYRADKLRLLELPGVRAAVLNGRDRALAAVRPAVATTSYGVPGGWDEHDGAITRRGEQVLAAGELALRGAHNALNLCGALAALEAFGVDVADLPGAVRGFKGLAHRLETVVDAHCIHVVDGGRVVERGTHAELLAQRGVYARLWALQHQTQDGTGQRSLA